MEGVHAPADLHRELGQAAAPGAGSRFPLSRAPALLLALGLLSLGYVAAALWLDVRGRRPLRPDARFDAIVLAGCRVLPDGRPSESLRRRALLAAALYHEGRAPVVVATGGSIGGRRSEAAAAAEVMRAAGVPSDAIVLEERSTTTRENAIEAAKLVPARRVVAVTDTFHVARCAREMRRCFAEVDAAGSVAPLRARVRGALREVAALVNALAAGR